MQDYFYFNYHIRLLHREKLSKCKKIEKLLVKITYNTRLLHHLLDTLLSFISTR